MLEEKGKAAAAGIVGAGAGFAAGLVLASKKAEAAPPSDTKAILDELAAIKTLLDQIVELLGSAPAGPPEWANSLIESIDSLNTVIDKLVTALGGIPGLALENPPYIIARQVLVPTAGEAVQMPACLIPYDKEVVIKALKSNTKSVYIGNDKVEAEDHTLSYPLEPGEAIGYKIKDLQQLWIDAEVSGEGVVWTVEREIE